MDAWDEGTHYDDYMGRWSRPMAREFLDWLGVPTGSRWVDVGCGTGALAGTILETAAPGRVAAVDPSPGFIAVAQRRLGIDGDAHLGSADELPFGPDEFDATVSGLALNFFPDPERALREMQRVTRSGGVVAVYVWDYAEGMQMIRSFWDVVVTLDPPSAHLDEASRFPLCDPGRLKNLFEGSGLNDVDVSGLEIPTVFDSFNAYWNPLLGGQGPAPTYVMSLDARQRQQLRSELEQALPQTAGRIELRARAWAAKGTV